MAIELSMEDACLASLQCKDLFIAQSLKNPSITSIQILMWMLRIILTITFETQSLFEMDLLIIINCYIKLIEYYFNFNFNLI